MAVDEAAFRSIVGSFPTGVVVVTAWNGDGTPRGLTISAFCSVSLEPPLVLVCVDKESRTLPAIQASARFAVNVLAEGTEELALKFATKRDDKFDAVATLDDRDPLVRSRCRP